MSSVQLFSLGAWLLVLLWQFPRDFWPKLRVESSYQHLVFASLAALSVLWSIQAGIKRRKRIGKNSRHGLSLSDWQWYGLSDQKSWDKSVDNRWVFGGQTVDFTG